MSVYACVCKNSCLDVQTNLCNPLNYRTVWVEGTLKLIQLQPTAFCSRQECFLRVPTSTDGFTVRRVTNSFILLFLSLSKSFILPNSGLWFPTNSFSFISDAV